MESIELTTHCHATEDLDKVRKALLNVIPSELRPILQNYVSTETFSGYYGNPITRLRLVVPSNYAEQVLLHILCSLPKFDREYLLTTLEQRYDSRANKLYLRLSKQEAYLGTLSLYDGGDAVRIVVSFSIVRSIDEVRKLLEELVKRCAD